jgi:serine/threonine protein kinase
MCAPNDVWSLGVILVNLTCGRNPWKQASCQDSTYRAYTRSQDFLKTILPLTNELNDILGRIFNPNPELRITLAELRCRIMACPQFTVPTAQTIAVQDQHVSHIPEYVTDEDAIVDDYEYDSPLSPASTTSDDGSLTSSGSTIDDLDDDDFAQEQQETPVAFATYEPEDTRDLGLYPGHGMQHSFAEPVAVPMPIQVPPQPVVCQQAPPLPIQAPIPVQAPCLLQKPYFQLWDVVRYVQQVPIMQHPVAFQQVPFIHSFQGCY